MQDVRFEGEKIIQASFEGRAEDKAAAAGFESGEIGGIAEGIGWVGVLDERKVVGKICSADSAEN